MKSLPKWLKIILIILAVVVGLGVLSILLGIFSGRTLSTLNAARDKGGDNAVVAYMKTLTIQGELYFDAHKASYAGFCNSTDALDSLQNAAKETGNGSNFVCNDEKQHWAASVLLRTVGFGYWCVDSAGTAVQITGNLTKGMMSCPP